MRDPERSGCSARGVEHVNLIGGGCVPQEDEIARDGHVAVKLRVEAGVPGLAAAMVVDPDSAFRITENDTPVGQ